MTHSPGTRTAFILRRMNYSRLLLSCVLGAVVIITAVVATLANFSARALPAAAVKQLATAPDTTIKITSAAGSGQNKAAGRQISRSLHAAFGPVPVSLLTAQWSDPLKLPTQSSGAIATAQIAAMDDITNQARLVAGRWPATPRAGQAVGIAIPASVAGPLGLRTGERLSLIDGDTQQRVALVITGEYKPTDPASSYWGLDLVAPTGVSLVPGFETFGPFVAQPGAFGPGQLTSSEQSWLAQPAVGQVNPADLAGLTAHTQSAVAQLRQVQNGGLQVTTSLPQLLAGTASSFEVDRSLLAMSALELLLVACAALALAAALLASQRTDESALLVARGLTRRQIAMLAVSEAVLLLAPAAIAGGAIGYWLAELLASTGQAPINAAQLASPGAALWWPALLVLVLAAVILAWPALLPGGAAGLFARGRRPALALATRAGADLAILTLAVVSGWQLRHYSVVAKGATGSIGVDPVLVAAPSLILIGAALIPLRLMPWLAKAGDRLSARGSRLVAALATWEISRHPVRQAGPALLAILAVGTGTLALAQQHSWRNSVRDQAAAQTGADVRVSVQPPAALVEPAVLSRAPVTSTMPVSEFNGGFAGQVVAIDAGTAAKVVLLRSDQAAQPQTALWRRISPARPGAGLTVPGKPVRLAIAAQLSSTSPGRAQPLAVTVSLQAADGVAYSISAGSLPADGHSHVLSAIIPSGARASYPLRLLGLVSTYQMPMSKAQSLQTAALTIRSVAASSAATGAVPAPFARGNALAGWQEQALSTTLATNQQASSQPTGQRASGHQPAILSWVKVGAGSQVLSFRPGYGYLITKRGLPKLPISATLALTAPDRAVAIPAIATRAFLAASSNHVGGRAIVAVGSYHVPVLVVAAIKSFPTAGPGGALIVDQQQIQSFLAAQAAPPVPVTSWWLATTDARIPRGIPAAQITSFRRVEQRMLSNSLSAAPQRAVFALILAVAVLAILGFGVSVAASVSERRARSALLSALGVTRLSQARQLCLEQALLAIPAAGAGLVVGAVLAHLLVPAVTITAQATLPNPPALVYIPAGSAIALAVIVAAIPILAAAVSVVRRPDPAAELRAAAAT